MDELNRTMIGTLIKSLRKQRKISYRELSKRANITGVTLLRIEAGLPFRTSTIRKLEQALNLSPGVLTHSAPFAAGPFFIQNLAQELVVMRPNPKYTKLVPEYSQEILQDPRERRRIGQLGIVSCFQWEPELGLKGASMRAILMELYDETLPNFHAGEELVFGIKGTSIIKIAGQEMVVHENETASFWPNERHSYAPLGASIGVPSLLLSVRIDSRSSVLGEPKSARGPKD